MAIVIRIVLGRGRCIGRSIEIGIGIFVTYCGILANILCYACGVADGVGEFVAEDAGCVGVFMVVAGAAGEFEFAGCFVFAWVEEVGAVGVKSVQYYECDLKATYHSRQNLKAIFFGAGWSLWFWAGESAMSTVCVRVA